MQHYLYLILDVGSLAFPLLASFESRVHFAGKWKGLFTGIFFMSLLFLPWDIYFTKQGYWGFEQNFLIGIDLFGLPLEEWLFFLFIPYSCMFLYEVMRFFLKKDVLGPIANFLAVGLAAVLLTVGLMNSGKSYTATTFLLCATLLLYHGIRKTTWLGRFFVGYLVSLIPFFVVNGVLTGSLLPMPIVWYNNGENLALRMGTIPVEDSMYLLLLLLIVTGFYERPLKRYHGDA